MSESLYLVCGLGNPTDEYKNTRHNLGFLIIDELIKKNNLKPKKSETDYMISDFSHNGKKIYLLKPLSFMNNSGLPLKKVLNYYKINHQNLVVVHDDLDLETGRIKFTFNGGSGGHNGVRSIISHLSTKDFFRLKVGIGKPKDNFPIERWVLSQFSEEELAIIKGVIDKCCDGILIFIEKGAQFAMNFINSNKLR